MKKHLDISVLKEKLKNIWKYFSDVSKFGGLFLLTVGATVVGGLILDNITNKPNENISIDTNANSVADDIISERVLNDIVPESTSTDIDSEDVITDNNGSVFEGIDAKDNTFDSFGINDDIHNGTMPKGTTPADITISEEMKDTLLYIQRLSIGCTKNWVDEKLGTPFVENVVAVTDDGRLPYDIDGNRIGENNIVDEFLECIYIFDIVSVKIYFGVSDYSCKAFFVTLMEDASGADIVMPETYSSFISNKLLGEFAFSEILWDPINVNGYVSQGVGRAFYGEQYYFAGSGNYQEFYFAVLDYGMLDSYKEFGRFLSLIQNDIRLSDDENSYYSSELLTQQRDKFYPNTYGISTLNYKITFSLLGTYVGFDSLPLRG